MTQLKQFMVVVTGYDLIPQVKKTRAKLLVLIVIFLLAFFMIQSSTITSITNDKIYAKVKEVSKEFDLLSEVVSKEEEKLIGYYSLLTFGLWAFMSFLSWILLNIILRPVSESIKEREQFIHNARHELRTPLTILQSELELFPTAKLDLESQMDLLGIKHQVTRMIDLSQNLLTNLSSNNMLLMTDSICVFQLINKINAQINSIYSCKSITIDNLVPEFLIDTNQSMFTQLITNVIENIYKHGAKNSKYTVDYTPIDKSLVFKNEISSIVIDSTHKGIGVIASNAIADKLNYTIVNEIIDGKNYITKIYLK
jgi:signal transduction histidine kinase